MNENSIYWVLGIEAIAAVILLVGFITSRNLPEKPKKIRVRKFAAVAIALMAFSFPIVSPYISSFSQASYLDELKAENLNSVEAIAEFETEQTKNIERLKSEISNLREDLYQLNRYYSFVIQMFSTGIIVACLLFAFGKKERVMEEIRSDQTSKL